MIKSILYASAIMLQVDSVNAAEPKVKTLEIGAQAPAFSLSGTDGKTYTLESFRQAKLLVLVFTSNHCPDARAARQRINTVAKNYKEKGVQVVAISGNDPKALLHWELGYSVYGDGFDAMKEVSKEEKFVHPYLYDGDKQAASTTYGAMATPHTFIFDQQRKLIYHGRFDNGRRDPGPATDNTVRENIDLALAGKAIKEPITRPFGCSTKWSWKRDWATKAEAEWQALPVTVDPLDIATAKKLAANNTEKIRVINFWSTSCGPCVAEFPDLIDAYRRYQRRGIELITVSLDPAKDTDKVLAFLKKEQLPLSPHGKKSVVAEGRSTNNYHFQEQDFDGLADVIDKKWAGPMPHTVVIAPGGKIVFRHTGQVDPVELRRAIVKQLETK